MSVGMSVTVLRCCPRAEKSLCPRCVRRLPAARRERLVRTYWEGDMLGHVRAADEALTWLRTHRVAT